MPERKPIKIGQVWKDTDTRLEGTTFTGRRHIKVIRVEGDVTKEFTGTVTVRNCDPEDGTLLGREQRIRADRMYPHSTGYALVKQAA